MDVSFLLCVLLWWYSSFYWSWRRPERGTHAICVVSALRCCQCELKGQAHHSALTQARSTAPSLQSAIYVKLSLWACCVVSGCTLSLAPPGTRARPGPRTDSDWHRPIFESTGKIGVVDRYYVFTRSLIPRLLQVVIPNHCAALAGKKQNTDGHCSNSSPHYKYKYYRAYLFEMWRQGVVGARVKRNALNVVNRANPVS